MQTNQITDTVDVNNIVRIDQALGIYKDHPIIGEPGVLEWLPVARLTVDDKYQREQRNDKARRMAKGFDWTKVKALNVCIRDHQYYVVDGQHTVAAAKLRGDIKLLPCYVLVDTTTEQEATMFLGINQDRTNVNAVEKHKAAVAAENKEALDIERIVKKHNLLITKHIKQHPNGISCVACLYKIEKHGQRFGGLDALLAVTGKAWGFYGTALRHDFLEGLYSFLQAAYGRESLEKIIARIGKVEADDILNHAINTRKAAGDGSGPVKMHRLISLRLATVHDKNSRSVKLFDFVASGEPAGSKKDREST